MAMTMRGALAICFTSALLACSDSGGVKEDGGGASDSQAVTDTSVGVDTTSPKQDQGPTPQEFCDQVGMAGCCDPVLGVVWCEQGQIKKLACNNGCGWDSESGIYDCDGLGEDPSGAHPKACPPVPGTCKPSCPAGKCGMDDGCGKTCGCKTGEVCQNGSCVPDTAGCTSGQTRCNGDDVEECVNGVWVKKETCPNGCLSGVCIGGNCNCPIPAAGIKVTFPYVSLSPPTVVKVLGACYVGTNPNPCGHKSTSMLRVLEYTGTSVSIKDLYGGYSWIIEFPVVQSDPTSSDISSLASKTGIAASYLNAGSLETIRLGGTLPAPVPVGYTLPAGVTLATFLGTSSTSKGYVRFESSSQSSLQPVLTQLGSGGITVDVTVGQLMGSSTYTYRLKLSTGGLKVEGITP